MKNGRISDNQSKRGNVTILIWRSRPRVIVCPKAVTVYVNNNLQTWRQGIKCWYKSSGMWGLCLYKEIHNGWKKKKNSEIWVSGIELYKRTLLWLIETNTHFSSIIRNKWTCCAATFLVYWQNKLQQKGRLAWPSARLVSTFLSKSKAKATVSIVIS